MRHEVAAIVVSKLTHHSFKIFQPKPTQLRTTSDFPLMPPTQHNTNLRLFSFLKKLLISFHFNLHFISHGQENEASFPPPQELAPQHHRQTVFHFLALALLQPTSNPLFSSPKRRRFQNHQPRLLRHARELALLLHCLPRLRKLLNRFRRRF